MPAAKTPETPEPRDYPVRGHFRRKERDPKTGIDVSVSYDPAGDDGWPGAKNIFTGVPGSPDVLELLAGADGGSGPLLWEIPDVPDETAGTSHTDTPSKES